jgi:hypothetical protein
MESVQRPKGSNGRCRACRHPERLRLDYLLATGASQPALAKKFGLSKDVVWRHNQSHIAEEFRRRVKIGPFESEEHLRQLCAEGGASVIDNLRAIYRGLASRWLVAFEAGADQTLSLLTVRMQSNLELQAKITKELAPPGAYGGPVTNNFYVSPQYLTVLRVAAVALRPYPEARRDFARALRDLDGVAPEATPAISPPEGNSIDHHAIVAGG